MRAVAHCADARDHAASDERGELEWKVAVDADACPVGHDRFLPEGCRAERGEQRSAVARVCIWLRERMIEAVLAQLWVSAQAEEALPARRDPREHDVVAGIDAGDLAARLEHDAGPLVAEHGRQRVRDRAVPDRKIGVAHAARRDAHMHVVRPERAQCHVVDRELLPGGAQHGRAHDGYLATGKTSGKWSA